MLIDYLDAWLIGWLIDGLETRLIVKFINLWDVNESYKHMDKYTHMYADIQIFHTWI